jgi:death-on-curing protein
LPSVSYLTVEEVEFIHRRVIAASGGSFGLRSPDLLDSAVARPRAGFGDEEFYPSIQAKAAALLESVILNHPFVDGNKRTAMVAAAMFLDRNGYTLHPTSQDLEDFAVHVAESKPAFEEIVAWLRRNSPEYPK